MADIHKIGILKLSKDAGLRLLWILEMIDSYKLQKDGRNDDAKCTN